MPSKGSIRLRIIVTAAVVAAAAVGGLQLLPSDDDEVAPIRVGTTDRVTSLDPAYAYDAGSWAIFSNVYQSLLTLKSGIPTPIPDAAKSCGFVGKKLVTYQCELNDNVVFSNGGKVTAEDVKFSFDRILRNKMTVGPRSLFASLKSVQVSGNKITFNLLSGDATFPLKIASGAGAIVDRSKYPAAGERTDGGVDGSGPYVMAAFSKEQVASLRPNPRYRGAVQKAGQPVDVRYYKKADDLLAAWEGEEVDVTHRKLPPKTLSELKVGDPNVRISEVQASETRNTVFNVRKSSPFANAEVRRAAAYLIDRPKLVRDVYYNTVEPLYDAIPKGIIGHSTPFFDVSTKVDPVKAKQELTEAGVQLPVRFTLGYFINGASQAEAKELKKQLESGGLFSVELVEKEVWEEFQQDYKEGKFDAYNVGWVADFPDPDNYSQPLVGKDNSNANAYANPEVDRLIVKTQGTAIRSDAIDDFKAMQRIVARDVPLAPLWQSKDYVLTSGRFGGVEYLSDGTGVWRLWELKRL
ncbi:ABC transporter substrate-binding protein [Streptomyces sp. NPDC051561]|uniref:ABC transporter substrate-binding protein n=1 Tax=Streptomyces sp. NPDC051561 TaxID=3365658 RepID=UPI0037B14126